MHIEERARLLKALADPTRLRIAGALAQKPHYVEELAERLDLAPSTVSAHLRKLTAAGLLECRREQYYAVYSLRTDRLDLRLLDLLETREADEEQARLERYRQKVLRAFFRDGRVIKLPAQRKKRWIVYREIIALLDPNKRYTERELNEKIKELYDDYCVVRRELIDEGALNREDGMYWLARDWNSQGFRSSYEDSISSRK